MITTGIIEACIAECKKSTYRFRVGAVIFSSKRILATGHNAIRSSTIPMKHRNYHNAVHAEQAAMMKVSWNNLKGASILVLKISKTTCQLSNSKPCIMCEQMIRHVGIKKIYYSDSSGQIVRYSFSD